MTVEDGVVAGGVGARIAQALRAAGIDVPTREIGIPVAFLDHGKVADVRAEVGSHGAGHRPADRRVVALVASGPTRIGWTRKQSTE